MTDGTFNLNPPRLQNVNKEEKNKDAVEEAAAAGADGDKKDVVGVKQEAVKVEQEVRVVSAKVEVKEEQEERPVDGQPAGGKEKEKERPDRGRLVMTIAGEQKMLHFDPIDVMTSATMMVGDKVSHWGGSINNCLINCQPQGHTPTSADRE